MPLDVPSTQSVLKSPLAATTFALGAHQGQAEQPPVETSRSSLKRKRSPGSGPAKSQSKKMAENLPSPSQHLDDVGPEQKRTKLGYHRTSIACGHCRHRKIRCLVSTGDESCTNCIRLKKDCFFHPVEPSQVKSKPRGKRSTSQLEKRRTLPIPSDDSHLQSAKKRFSDSAVAYSTASRGLITHGLNNPSGLLFEEPKNLSESSLENYSSLLDPGLGVGMPSFSVLEASEEPRGSYGMSYSRHSIPAVSPRSQFQGLSPSPHPEFNHQLAIPSPQITFTPDLSTPDWGKSLPTSSYDSYLNHQSMISPRGSRQQYPHSTPQIDLMGMKSHLLPGTSDYSNIISSEDVQMPLSAVSSMSVPALSISQSVSPFSEQNAWSGFSNNQESNSVISSKGFEDYIPEPQWFPFQ